MPLPELTPDDLARYARQLALPEFGPAAQQRLKRAAVLCVGAGGLGSPAALYLAAAGVGRLGIVDPDHVDRSNLQRQVLHGEATIGHPKTDSAAARLHDLNPQVEVVTHPTRLTPDNATAIARHYDLLVDGSDNFPARFLINDLCYLLRIPNCHGAVRGLEGHVTVLAPHLGGPCLRCILPTLPPPPPPPPAAAGPPVLGVVPGVIGCLQALEAIKLLAGIGTPALGRLVHFDALALRFRELAVARDPRCRLCGSHPEIHSPDTPEARAADR